MSADQKCANKYLMSDSVLKKYVVYIYIYIYIYFFFFLHTTP